MMSLSGFARNQREQATKPSPSGSAEGALNLEMCGFYALLALMLGGGVAMTVGVAYSVVIGVLLVGFGVVATPFVIVVVAAARRLAEPRPRSYLGARLRVAARLLWAGGIFVLATFVAVLIGNDVDRAAKADYSSIRYFFELGLLLSPPVLWAAVVAVVVPSSWAFAAAPTRTRASAVLPLLRASRVPLSVQMWLEDERREGDIPPLPSQRANWWWRQLSSPGFANMASGISILFALSTFYGATLLIGALARVLLH